MQLHLKNVNTQLMHRPKQSVSVGLTPADSQSLCIPFVLYMVWQSDAGEPYREPDLQFRKSLRPWNLTALPQPLDRRNGERDQSLPHFRTDRSLTLGAFGLALWA